MQDFFTPRTVAEARVSRRDFIAFAAAGSAATLPAAAFAEASGKTSRLPQSLDHQLDACVSQLKAILVWDGPGVYELTAHGGMPAGAYHVRRVWCDENGVFHFYAAFMFGGNPVAPRERIDLCLIVRKLEGGDA